MAQAIGRHVLAAAKIQTDDTPIRVLGGQSQQARTGRPWTYVRDDRASGDATPAAVWFQYSPNSKGEHPRRHLAGFKGIVQACTHRSAGALPPPNPNEGQCGVKG